MLQTATNTPTATNSLIEHVTTTAPPGWYTGLPKKVKTELLKEQNMLQSAADKALGVTRTSEGRGMETKVPVVGGVAVAGFLGGVAML